MAGQTVSTEMGSAHAGARRARARPRATRRPGVRRGRRIDDVRARSGGGECLVRADAGVLGVVDEN